MGDVFGKKSFEKLTEAKIAAFNEIEYLRSMGK